ncbi:MAG: hypothetical protein AYK22_00025 [Thermoplasmatales archaeon SG8-52-3]|nr:MAG: hypothetical protein AYK22_00025 [Thermoplasmatales archaeon SG8-52-3]
MLKEKKFNLAKKFEKEYYPCTKEWWCAEGFFKTIENNKNFCFKSTIFQGIGRDKTLWTSYSISIFDLDNNKIYKYSSLKDKNKLDTEKEFFNIKYEKSYITGSYPNYKMYFFDLDNNINLNLKFHSNSLPYWVAQKITNGSLPWNLGYFEYGFIPKNKILGYIKINNNKFTLEGKGYFEHIWGNFSYISIFSSKVSLKKTISTYLKLILNWLRNQDLKIPNSITFSTNNRPPGYDWIWAVLDNEWSIFFGNMMFWIMDGIGTGILIFSKDGKNYTEFSNIQFKYKKMKYLKKYDFYYPIELQIIAKKENETLFLNIKNLSESSEDITEATIEKNLLGFLISEVPCKISGYYNDCKKKIILKGFSKIESHRLLKPIGYNSLKINFEKTKNKLGLLSSFDSHYFRKKIDIKFDIYPKFKFKINFKRIVK